MPARAGGNGERQQQFTPPLQVGARLYIFIFIWWLGRFWAEGGSGDFINQASYVPGPPVPFFSSQGCDELEERQYGLGVMAASLLMYGFWRG